MTKLMFACVAALALTACPNKPKGGEAVSKMAELKDKMCACKTPECAHGVTEEEAKWSQAMAKESGDKVPKLSDEETKKVADINQQFSKCLLDATKVGTAPNPETPPTPVAPEATGSGTGSAAGSATK
jgi:hypothetical protein